MVIALPFQSIQLISNSDKLRTIVPYTIYCLSVRLDEGTRCSKGFVIVSSDLTKNTAFSNKQEFSSSKPNRAPRTLWGSCTSSAMGWVLCLKQGEGGAQLPSLLIELYVFFFPDKYFEIWIKLLLGLYNSNTRVKTSFAACLFLCTWIYYFCSG